jgi:hypothetical protein
MLNEHNDVLCSATAQAEEEEFHDAAESEDSVESDVEMEEEAEGDDVDDESESHESQEDLDNAEMSEITLTHVGSYYFNAANKDAERKLMKYKVAMEGPDRELWKVAVHEEKNRFDKYETIKQVPRSSVPKHCPILDSMWTMKKKSDGTFRARLNLCGSKQIDGEHYMKIPEGWKKQYPQDTVLKVDYEDHIGAICKG